MKTKGLRHRIRSIPGDRKLSAATDEDLRPMLSSNRQIDITNTLGLHLRAADKFVRMAQKFRAEVSVICGDRRACGKSILDLATLAAGCGSRLELETDGPDAEAALDALAELIGPGI